MASTRSVVRRDHALIAPDSFVATDLPWLDRRAKGIILISPSMGARFVQYLAILEPGGRVGCAARGRAGGVRAGGRGRGRPGSRSLGPGGYAYLPDDATTRRERRAGSGALFEKRYVAAPASPRRGPWPEQDVARRRSWATPTPAPGAPARRPLRPGRQHHRLRARRHAADGRDPRHGARPADARRAGVYRLGDAWYRCRRATPSGWRRTARSGSGAWARSPPATLLQGREPRSPGVIDHGAPLIAELEELARLSDRASRAVTRVLYTEPTCAARASVRAPAPRPGWRARGRDRQHVRPLGGRRARTCRPSPPGSHIDAIPDSGRFDGTVGVLGGLEAIRALRAAGLSAPALDRADHVHQRGADPVRHRLPGQPGSGRDPRPRSASPPCGTPTGARSTRSAPAAGFAGPLGRSRLPEGHYAAFVELHIEQGPILEREGVPIGVVTAIAAPATLRVTLEGEGGHAGAVLMPDRRDALCGRRRDRAGGRGAPPAAAGGPTPWPRPASAAVHPGAVNSIPRRVLLEIDVRDIDLATARPGGRAAIARRRSREVGRARAASGPGRRPQRRPARHVRPGRRRRAVEAACRRAACLPCGWSAGPTTIPCSWPGSAPPG